MKKIVFLRSNQIYSDSRAEKYLSFFKENSIEYLALGWDRSGSGITREKTEYYDLNCGYVLGGLKAAYNRFKWFGYVIKKLRSQKPEFIHACDLDCAFPAALYKVLFNKNVYVLFDVFDWMSDDVAANGKWIIRKSIEWMETFTLKHANKLLICEEERRAQIPDCDKYDVDVLPNIPMVADTTEVCVEEPTYKFNNGLVTLSYVGGLGASRNIEELLEMAKAKKINLLIAGYGSKELEEICSDLNNQDNVKYFGKVKYFDGLKIMYNADCIYAMYCKNIKNHIFAAPNKYYEALLLGKPLITTSGIIVADKVKKYNVGYSIEEDLTDFERFISSYDIEDAKIKAENAKNLWEEKYKTYTHDYLIKSYYNMIN